MPGDIEITLTTNPTADVQNLRTNIQKTVDDAAKDPFDIKLSLNVKGLNEQLGNISQSVRNAFGKLKQDLADVANDISQTVQEINSLNMGTGNYDFNIRTNAGEVYSALTGMIEIIDSFSGGDRREFSITVDLNANGFYSGIEQVRSELVSLVNKGEPYAINIVADVDRAKKDIDHAREDMAKYIEKSSARQDSFTETNEITPRLVISSNINEVIEHVNDLRIKLDSLTGRKYEVSVDLGENIAKFLATSEAFMSMANSGRFADSLRRAFSGVTKDASELIQNVNTLINVIQQFQFLQTPAGQRATLFADTYNNAIDILKSELESLDPLMQRVFGDASESLSSLFTLDAGSNLRDQAKSYADGIQMAMNTLKQAGLGEEAERAVKTIGSMPDEILAKAEKMVSFTGKFNEFLSGATAGKPDTSGINDLSRSIDNLKGAIGSINSESIGGGVTSVVKSVEGVETAVRDAIEAVNQLKDALAGMGSNAPGKAISDSLMGISTTIGTLKEGANGSIVDTLTRMATAVESLNQAASNAAFVKTFEGLPQVISSINESLSTLKGFLDGVQTKSAEAGNSGQQAFEGIRQGSDVVKESLRGVGEQATATGVQITDAINDSAKSASGLESVKQEFIDIWKSFGEYGSGSNREAYIEESVFNGFSDLLRKLYEPIKAEAKTIRGGGNPIVKFVNEFAGNAKDDIQQLLDVMKNAEAPLEERIESMSHLIMSIRATLDMGNSGGNFKTISDILNNFAANVNGGSPDGIYEFGDAIDHFMSVIQGSPEFISSYDELVSTFSKMPSLKLGADGINEESELYGRALTRMADATKEYMKALDANIGKGTSNKLLDMLNNIPSLASRVGVESGKFKQFFKKDFLGGNLDPTLENFRKVAAMFNTFEQIYNISQRDYDTDGIRGALRNTAQAKEIDLGTIINNITAQCNSVVQFIEGVNKLVSDANLLKASGVDLNAILKPSLAGTINDVAKQLTSYSKWMSKDFGLDGDKLVASDGILKQLGDLQKYIEAYNGTRYDVDEIGKAILNGNTQLLLDGEEILNGARKYSEAAQIKSEADKQMSENAPAATTSPFIESIKAGVADVKAAVENVKQAIDDLKGALSGLNSGQSSDVFNTISESIMGISKAIGTIGEGKTGDIITTFSNMSGYIQQIMGDLQTLKDTFKTGFVVPDTSTTAIDNIGTKLDDTKNKFAETGAVGSAAMAEVTQGAEQVGDAIERVKQEWASRMEGITSENDIWASARDTLKEWAGSVDKIIKKGMSGSSVAGRTSAEKWINSVSDISHLELFKNIKSAMKSEDIEEQTRAYYDYIKLVKELDEVTLSSSGVRAKVLDMGKELAAFFNGDMVTGNRNADDVIQNATQNIDTLHQYNDALSEAQAKSQQLNDETARQASTATNIGAVAEQAGKLNEAMSSISAEAFNSSIESINSNIGLVKTAVEGVTGAIGELKKALSGLNSNQPSDAFRTIGDTIQGVSKVIGTFGEGVDSSIAKVLTDISSAVTQLGQLPSNSGFTNMFEGLPEAVQAVKGGLSELSGTKINLTMNKQLRDMLSPITQIGDKVAELMAQISNMGSSIDLSGVTNAFQTMSDSVVKSLVEISNNVYLLSVTIQQYALKALSLGQDTSNPFADYNEAINSVRNGIDMLYAHLSGIFQDEGKDAFEQLSNGGIEKLHSLLEQLGSDTISIPGKIKLIGDSLKEIQLMRDDMTNALNNGDLWSTTFSTEEIANYQSAFDSWYEYIVRAYERVSLFNDRLKTEIDRGQIGQLFSDLTNSVSDIGSTISVAGDMGRHVDQIYRYVSYMAILLDSLPKDQVKAFVEFMNEVNASAENSGVAKIAGQISSYETVTTEFTEGSKTAAESASQFSSAMSSISLDDIKSQFAGVVEEIKKVVSAIDELKKSLEGVSTASGITALGDRIEQGLGKVISAIGKVRKVVGDLPSKISIDTSEAESKLNNVGQKAKDVANDVNNTEGHVKVDGTEAEQTMMKLGQEAADLRENLTGATTDTNAAPTNAETSMQGVSDVLSSIIAKAEDGKYVMTGLGEVFTEVTSDANKIYERFANIYGPDDDSLKKWYDTMSGITKLVPDIFGKSKMQQPDIAGLKATVDEMKSAISEYLRLRDEFAKDHGLTLEPLTINDKAVAAMTSAPLREITEAANARAVAESQAASAANESANAEERASSAAHDAAAAEERIAAGEKERAEYQMRIADMMSGTSNAEEQVASGAERASAATQGMADNVARASEGMAQMGHAISQYETQDIAAALRSQVDISSADADKIAQSISNANVQIKSMQASWVAVAGEADSLLNVIVRGNNELGQSVQYTLNYNTKNGELLDTVTKVAAKFQDINEENKKFSQELNAQQSAQQSLTTLLDNAQKTLAGFAGLKDDAQVGDSYSRLGMLVDDIAKYKDMADTAGMSTQDITENVKRLSSELANLKSELGGIQAQMKDVNAQQNAQRSLTSLLGNSQRALNAYAGIKENPQASEAYSRLSTLVDDIAKFKNMADTAGASTQEITENVVRWSNALGNLKLQLGTVQDEVNANQKASKAASKEVIDQEKAQEAFTKLLANAQEALKSYQSISGNDKSQGVYADLQSMTSDMEQFQAVIQSTGAVTDVIREKTAQYSNTFAGLKATLSSVQSEVDAEVKVTQQSAAEHDKHNAALTAYTKAMSDVNAMVEKYANSMNSANPLARDAYVGLMQVRDGLQALRPDIEAAGTSTEDIKNTTSDARREMEAYKATIEATDGAYQRSVDAQKKLLDVRAKYFGQMRKVESLQYKYKGMDLTGYDGAPDAVARVDDLMNRMIAFKGVIDNNGASVDEINTKYSAFNEELARIQLALNKVTAENRNYIEVAKKNNAKNQYNDVFRDVGATLEKYAAASNSANSEARGFYLELQALQAAMTDYNSTVGNSATSTEEIKKATSQFSMQLAELKANLESTGVAHKTFGQSVASMTRMFASWFSGSRIVLYVVRSLRNMVKTTVELDDAMTQMQIVTHASDTAMNEFAQSAADAAKSVGASITDFTNAATTFARLGYSMDESSSLAKLSTMLQNVGDIEAADAQDALTAILKAFPEEVNVDNMESAMDKLVVVGNNFPISVSQLAEGMNNAASSLAAAGNSFEQSVALMMVANTTVNICRAT